MEKLHLQDIALLN